MTIYSSNPRIEIRVNGKTVIVASAEGGGRTDGNKVTLRNLVLTEEGHGLLSGEYESEGKRLLVEQGRHLVPAKWDPALGRVLEIVIRNSNSKHERFECRADLAGLSGLPTTEPLASVEFWIL